MRYPNKFRNLLLSRRFQLAVIGIVVVLLHETLGVDEETARTIAVVIVGWFFGDSITKTT